MVSPGHRSLFADALRPDDDVGQVEMDVRERRQQTAVEARRAVVPFPAIAGLHELVDTVVGERRDQPRHVPLVLGDRVAFPEVANL